MSGRTCRLCSIRESDSRSSTRRAIRRACSAMMARKRLRARGSSRAGPCRVSTKPSSDARGVRSSWLALATKSARIRSTRRDSVRSRKVITTAGASSGRRRGATVTSKARSTGTRSRQATVSIRPEAPTRRIASRMSGSRNARASAPSGRRAGSIAFAGRLAAMTLASPDTTSTESGIASISASITARDVHGALRSSMAAAHPKSLESPQRLNLPPRSVTMS